MKLTFSATRALQVMIIVVVMLMAAHFWTRHYLHTVSVPIGSIRYHLLHKLSLEADAGIGMWYTQAGMLVAAILLFVMAAAVRKAGQKYGFHWYLLGFLFLYLSIDESISLHELTVEPVRNLFQINGGYLYFAWIVPALAIMGLLAALYLKLWLQFPRVVKVLFLASFLVYAGGAAGLEAIGAHYYSLNATDSNLYILFALEEFMEMAGISLFIYTLLRYLASSSTMSALTFRVRSD